MHFHTFTTGACKCQLLIGISSDDIISEVIKILSYEFDWAQKNCKNIFGINVHLHVVFQTAMFVYRLVAIVYKC